MLAPEDVKQIVDAMEQLDWVQWVKQQMGGGAEPSVPDAAPDMGADAGAAAGGMPPPDQNAAGMPPAAPPMGGGAPPVAPPMPPQQQYKCDDEDTGMMSRYAAGEVSDDEMMEHLQGRKASYAASLAEGSATDSDPGKPSGEGDVADRTAYSRQVTDHDAKMRYSRLEREHQQLRQKVATLERDKRDQYRRARLSEKQAEGYVFDLADELKETADLSDKQFETHLTRVERYERAPLGAPILFAPPLDQPKTDKYQRERVDAIKRLAQEKGCSWDEAKREWDSAHPVTAAG